jgi:hypothetical protein
MTPRPKAFLASILLDPYLCLNVLPQNAATGRETLFSVPSHRQIWNAMTILHRESILAENRGHGMNR